MRAGPFARPQVVVAEFPRGGSARPRMGWSARGTRLAAMSVRAVRTRRPRAARPVRAALPAVLERRFEAIVFDWDGTAVTDRDADASTLRELVHELSALGLDLAVITGTHVGNVDGQLGARPPGPGHLYFCVNRGSEVFEADADGLRLLYRREATGDEDAALDTAAAVTVAELQARGLAAELRSQPRARPASPTHASRATRSMSRSG